MILLGHTKIENTVRYLGVDVEDALLLAERTEICTNTVVGFYNGRPLLAATSAQRSTDNATLSKGCCRSFRNRLHNFRRFIRSGSGI